MKRAKSAQAPADNPEVIRLTSDEINHKKLRVRKLHRFTILHYSPFKALWDWFVLLLVVYTAIFTPYSAAFLLRDDQKRTSLNKEAETRSQVGPSESYTNPLVIIDLIVDVMFIVDIFINFRTTFIDDQKGEVVSDPAKIAKNYLKGWFVIDVMAAIPFDLLMFGLASDEGTTTAMGLLKTARLLRLLRVARRVDHYSQYAPAVVILLMCAFSLVAHWLACIWYAIGEAQREHLNYGWLETLSFETDQPYRNDSTGGPALESRYITSLYFTLTTLTTVGFGNVAANTDAEKIFSIIIMLLGSLMFAIIFGNMTAIIDRLYEGMSRYHQQMNLVKEFVKFHNVPIPLGVRLQEYFKHAWVNMNGNDIEEVSEVMKDFPDFLQADISLHLNRNLLRSSPAFQGVNQGCLRALSIRLQTTHTAPGDILIHKGDNLNIMYFISRGSLEILQGNIVLAILGKNDVVGENFCQKDNVGRSKGTVRALTYCDLLTLSRADLEDLCQLYPEFKEHFAEKVEVTIEMRDLEDSDSEQQPMIPDARDPEAAKPADGASLPRKRRVGADLHTRVTLTPVPSKENVQRSGDDASYKGNRQSAMLLMQMQIERGHMAQENVQTVPVSMEDISTIAEETNNNEDTIGETALHVESESAINNLQSKTGTKHVNFRLSADTTLSSPNLTVGIKNGVLSNSIQPFWGREVLNNNNQGTTSERDDLNTSSIEHSIGTLLKPAVIVNDVDGDDSPIQRRIDGLYDQLTTIESRFEEQRAAIIQFIVTSHQAKQAHAQYMQVESPEPVRRENRAPPPSPQASQSLLHNGDQTTSELSGGGANQMEMNVMAPSSPKAKSFPNIASDAKDDHVPSYYQMQLQNTHGMDKYQKTSLPRPGRRKGQSSSAGHVSTANWNVRSPGRVVSAKQIPPLIVAKDSDPIWHERDDNGDGSYHYSSTDC